MALRRDFVSKADVTFLSYHVVLIVGFAVTPHRLMLKNLPHLTSRCCRCNIMHARIADTLDPSADRLDHSA